MISYFQRFQNDVAAVLLADGYFADITAVAVRSLEADNMAAAAVAGTKKKNGKAGVAVRVLMPAIQKTSQVVVGLLRTRLILRVAENPTINQGSIGTGKSAEEVAAKCYDLIDRLKLGWSAHEVKADADEVDAVVEDTELRYDLPFYTYLPTTGRVVVATPTVTVGATVSLACATAGATIYYTSNGVSFPSASSGGTLYTAPFTTPAAGTLLRVAAFKTGSRQSDVVHKEIA
jgi:hypothetical protein